MSGRIWRIGKNGPIGQGFTVSLRDTLVSFAVTVLLVGGFYLDLQIHHRLNQRRSDVLFHDARVAYNRAAQLKDADHSQFIAAYSKARAAISDRETFNAQNGTGLAYMNNATAADVDLMNCLDALAIRRSPETSEEIKLRIEQEIEHCDAHGTFGGSSDMK
jgi:hypothetical protein